MRQGVGVGRHVGGQGLAAHVFQIMGGFVRGMAVAVVFLVMAVFAVRAVHQGVGHGVDPVKMDEDEGADGERRRGVDRSGGGAAEMFDVAAGDEIEEIGEGNAAEDVAETR